MNFAQTIDPETPMVPRRSWSAILAQLQGEPVPTWCLPEPSALQTSARGRGPEDAADDEAADEELEQALDEPALRPLETQADAGVPAWAPG